MHVSRILRAVCLTSLFATVQIACSSDKNGTDDQSLAYGSGTGGVSQYPANNATGSTTPGVGTGAGTGGGGTTSVAGGGQVGGFGGEMNLGLDASVATRDGGGIINNGTAGTTPTDEPSQCGNGIIESGEDCESNTQISQTCQDLGNGSGSVSCDATCHFDLTGCSTASSVDGSLFTVNYETSSVIGTVGIVTWSTTVSSVSEAYIEFGLDTNYGMKAPVDLNEPQYRTLLLGMKGSHDYHFRIAAKSSGTEYKSDDYTITTGPVTNLAQVLELNVDNAAARAGGFIVTSLYQSGGPFGGGSGGFAFIVDSDGDVVWWYDSSLSSATRARMSYDGKYMWMATKGMTANGIERVSMDGLDARSFSTPITHDISAVTGDVMAYPAGGFNSCVVITEITPDGTTKPVYDTSQIWGGGPCHANAIRYSETEGVYTMSDLRQGDIIIVDRATGKLLHRMKEYSFSWGNEQHRHHLLDNSIVIYNNGSRIAQEISFDEATMQSAEIWRYGTSYNTQVLGDVQRLPNGNTMVTYSTAGRIHEVGQDENRIAEFRFSQAIGYSVWRESLYGPPPDILL